VSHQWVSPEVTDGLLDLYAAFRPGWASTSRDELERLLGRAPIDPIEALSMRSAP
jgi:hypothetical protein